MNTTGRREMLRVNARIVAHTPPGLAGEAPAHKTYPYCPTLTYSVGTKGLSGL